MKTRSHRYIINNPPRLDISATATATAATAAAAAIAVAVVSWYVLLRVVHLSSHSGSCLL